MSKNSVQQPGPAIMRRLGRRFVRDRSGATAIEFGFVMVPFFALLFSIFENAFLLMNDNGLEQAVATASRQVLLGNVQSNGAITTADQFRDQVICNPPGGRVLPSYIDCSKLVVNMQALPAGQSFAGVDPTANFYSGSAKFCSGGPAYIVMVNVMYPMPSYFPILNGNWNVNGGVSTTGLTTFNGKLSHIIVATSVFQNEPFAAWSGPRPGC